MVECGLGDHLCISSPGIGEGTTVRITIPLPWLHAAGESSNPLVSEKMGISSWLCYDTSANVDVLIVDDMPIVRKVTGRMCERYGLDHDEASSGEQALSMLARKRYSLVAIDRQMPGINGDVATSLARDAGYTGPIALVTGDVFDQTQVNRLLSDGGLTAILPKAQEPGIMAALKILGSLKIHDSRQDSIGS
jgi:CheY-like chemotaxis protein